MENCKQASLRCVSLWLEGEKRAQTADHTQYFYIVILEVNPVCVCIQRTEMGQVRAGACCEGVGTCLMPPVNLCSHHLLSL